MVHFFSRTCPATLIDNVTVIRSFGRTGQVKPSEAVVFDLLSVEHLLGDVRMISFYVTMQSV